MGIFDYIRGKNHYKQNHEYFEHVLEHHSDYYKGLDYDSRTLFLQRLAVFIVSTNFSSEDGFDILPEMKVVISSAFVQITFGLRKFRLKRYNNIFVAPQAYSYQFDQRLLAGDINGVLNRISLSWPHVLKGFEIPDDAINVAINQFSRCLTLENFSKSFFGRFFDQRLWDVWMQEGIKGQKLLRGTNKFGDVDFSNNEMMEMFAVTMVTFFERPEDLATHLPSVFDAMKQLLNQDPRNASNPTLYDS